MRSLVAAVVAASALALIPAAAAHADTVYARVEATQIVLGNELVERRWARAPMRTVALDDKRGRGWSWNRATPDFALGAIRSDAFAVTRVDRGDLPGGGIRLTMTLTGPPGLTVKRIAEAYPGVAGFRMQTIVEPAGGLAIGSAVLEQAATGAATPTLHAFRAGADWRDAEWAGPPLQVGDPHAGTWRDTRTAARGQAVAGSGQWLSVADGERSVFLVAEGTDFPSSRGRYDGATAQLRNDYGQDVVLFGPLEESAHVENPVSQHGRHRVAGPGQAIALEPVFVGFGHGDGDAEWQFAKYLRRHRLASEPGRVVFNSDRLDDDRSGAKDDADYAMVQRVAETARRLGVETFVLDDGWQEVSGDWNADPARYPDPDFAAVREAIAPMRLGLWMSAMHFHPDSRTFREHPEWACQPFAAGLYAYNRAEPEDGSNEAGIVPWGPDAIPFVEGRIRKAIAEWGVTYFKFDFLAWLDCADQGDFHAFRDAFVAMLDRVRADHPSVTLQVDETNDYRLFPFASTTRGPTWFQNGNPEPHVLLHNVWNLSPYVPAYAIGQHVLGGDAWKRHPVATLMAAALPSHITYFTDIRTLPDHVIDEAGRWIAWYRANRALFTDGVTYPLLADPLERGWTALQSWDPERGEGALVAFRQDAEESSRAIALRNVPPGRTFRLTSAPDGADLGTVTSEQLRSGLAVEVPAKGGARAIAIRPAG
ncbi:MAG TPA: alpha-galactosidase [Solirubrobacteraceae bacterium]|nr:alpha-galactosidase [Solirubrobacteraceae bacterium]